jgi:large subunit ribosomal protein L31
MKADTHPTYFSAADITCACGAKFPFGSTKQGITVEICSQCHPFYTGNDKTLDAAGMVDKFKNRAAKAKKK